MSCAAFRLRGHNPDILTCIANLSNDEVFTPPKLAADMLDLVAHAWAQAHDGADLWADPNVRFLDPCTKSGVFLREITRRLTDGLAEQMPDLAARVDHILTRQVYGLGITQLTALLARRSVYCTKHANGRHTIAPSFTSDQGNIWFERTEHAWVRGRCRYCGASQSAYDRGEELESHAYAFIHTDDPATRLREMFGADMQFDVIVGNPPYQLSDGGHGASALPMYHRFVTQAKALDPSLLTMVVPSRWMFGGRGLSTFRLEMLTDKRIARVMDYTDSKTVFDQVDVAGGVCYFLWVRNRSGECEISTHGPGPMYSHGTRPLLEPGADFYIRHTESINILRRVAKVETGRDGTILPANLRFERQVSGQKPFGLRTYYRGNPSKRSEDDVLLLQAGGQAWVPRRLIETGEALLDRWKVFTSKSSSEHAGQADKNGMRRVLSLTGVLPPGSAVTETYVLLGSFESENAARNCLSYSMTKFFRFLVATRTSAQDLPRSAYSLVPIQDYRSHWTDEMLYVKYGLSEEEIHLIESTIRPMDAADE